MNTSNNIEARLARLEAESEIRKLKARYLNSCDAKDVAAIRACFTADAELDYQPLGKFDVDGLIEIFTKMAVEHPIVDVHQIHNGEIEVIDDSHARARWNLSFTTFNPEDKSFRLIGSFYHDEYLKTEVGWRVSRSLHEPRLVIDGTVADGTVQVAPLLPG